MKDLTFGEQVKIILNRKGMTIKELAEQIQEETGKAMSRQNLTQRLGRDNFQEQDMRMIAKILGCPFRLSIFPTVNDEEFQIDEDAFLNYTKKSAKKKKEEQEEDIYQQEFVFDDMMTASVAEMPTMSETEEIVEELEEELIEEVELPEEELVEEVEESEEVELPEEELVEEVEELEEEPLEEVEEAEEAEEELVEEVELPEEELLEEVEEPVEAVAELPKEEPVKEKVEEHKTERFRGGLFFRGFGRNKKHKKEDKTYEAKVEEVTSDILQEKEQEVIEKEEEIPEEDTRKVEVEPVNVDNTEIGEADTETFDVDIETTEQLMETEEVIIEESETKELEIEAVENTEPVEETEDSEVQTEKVVREETVSNPTFIEELEKFEPIVKHQEENEDLKLGELNPYTGHEYQTNSVRMHPSKIGYVQVYDRTKHGWVDMTEWAFLGYQEKKKRQLGRNYEPPIYLD